MLLFLIGMPGCGKTKWMNLLSKELNIKGYDLDYVIENSCKKTIPTLFEIGEDYFRIQENKVLTEIIKSTKKNTIIATGGGTPCFYDNFEQMKNSGCVLYLKLAIDDLVVLLQDSIEVRPLLQNNKLTLKEKLEFLELQRKPFFEKADLIIDANQITLPIFVSLLKPFLNLNELK